MEEEKRKPINASFKPITKNKAEQQLLARLKELEKRVNLDPFCEKIESPDIYFSDAKEIASLAALELGLFFQHHAKYNLVWLRNLIEIAWPEAGRGDQYTAEKRIRCCQFIYLLCENGCTFRQASGLTDRIMGFTTSESKKTYGYFEKALEKQYFPHLKSKKQIPLRIILDVIHYGDFKKLNIPQDNKKDKVVIKDDTKIILDKIINDADNYLRSEIKRVESKKKGKLEIKVHPIIIKYLNYTASSPFELIKRIDGRVKIKITRDDEGKIIKRDVTKKKLAANMFIFYTRQFLDDLEFYEENKKILSRATNKK